jgi:hypothetical protein
VFLDVILLHGLITVKDEGNTIFRYARNTDPVTQRHIKQTSFLKLQAVREKRVGLQKALKVFNVPRIHLRNFSVEADLCLIDISKGLLTVKQYFPKSWKRCLLNTCWCQRENTVHLQGYISLWSNREKRLDLIFSNQKK